eukprot:TRINITY_DN827_c0_g1_i3.p1 TRINITY_DN827_c0_g1~~TRINITY_DN827_c0_g1_i3.p1  ORF type:complete len:113 (+),score=12.22 TRINITY_DN827_c0_g1_i3:180-518(+)
MYSCLALVGLPIAFFVDWGMLRFIPDLAITAIVPLHFHVALLHIVEDYTPLLSSTLTKPFTSLVWLITGMTVLGLLWLTVKGDGIVNTVRSFWIKDDDKHTEHRVHKEKSKK